MPVAVEVKMEIETEALYWQAIAKLAALMKDIAEAESLLNFLESHCERP